MIETVRSTDLLGERLDWAVAVALGNKPKVITSDHIMSLCCEGSGEFRPSLNWWQAGMLIEKYGLVFDTDDKSIIWARHPSAKYWSGGSGHREAACRAVIDYELGKKFDIDFPSELLKSA